MYARLTDLPVLDDLLPENVGFRSDFGGFSALVGLPIVSVYAPIMNVAMNSRKQFFFTMFDVIIKCIMVKQF